MRDEEINKQLKEFAELINNSSEARPSNQNKKQQANPLDQLLAEVLGASLEKTEAKLPSAADQKKSLTDFLANNKPAFKVGDFVRPNQWGKTRYRIRDERMAVIDEIYPENEVHLDKDGDRAHGSVTIVFVKDDEIQLVSKLIDFRYFEKLNEAKDEKAS